MMKKSKKINFISDEDKAILNCRHVNLFNVALDSVEILLKNFLDDIQNCSESPLELSKNTITTLDFLISAISKIQKGQRLALDLDKTTPTESTEPKINYIEGVDIKKV